MSVLHHGGGEDFLSEMAIPEVNRKLLGELEGMGFPLPRATRALHFSGNVNLEAAVNWIIDHENDPDLDQMPLVAVNIDIESPEPSQITDEIKTKAQELRFATERIRAGKELLEAKRIDEVNQRKRILAAQEVEKAEERRARERIRQKIQQDRISTHVQYASATKAEQMRECLRMLRRSHKNEDARVRRAFQTLLTYVSNIARSPNEEKFRKIRFGNPNFQERVGSLNGGIEFLVLCGFEKIDGGKFLYLPRVKVDMAVLGSAGSVIYSAMTNPYFGLLS
ncbi:Ubiquitin-associated domain, partial [Dillenia turbinata]